MSRSLNCWAGRLLSAACLALAATPASAQTFWQPTAGGNWSLSSNWDLGIPNAASAWAQFSRSGSGSQTVTVDGTFTVGRLTFRLGTGSSATSYSWTLGGGAITLNNGASAALIERGNSDGNQTINTPLTISGNGSLTVNNGGFTASGVSNGAITLASLAGSNSNVTINATGTTAPGLVVIQSGTYGGANSTTTVSGGILRADEGVGLPTNTLLVINGGTGAAGWEVSQDTTLTRTLGSANGNIRVIGTTAGFAAFNGTLTLNFNGGGQIQWGSTHFNPTNLQLGRGATGTAGVSDNYVFQNGLDLNGATRNIRTGVGSGGIRAVAKFTGNIVNTSGTASGLTIAGSGGGGGTVELSGTNTYNGTTTVSGLTVLRANEGVGLSANTSLVLNGGVLENNGTQTFSRTLGTAAGQVQVVGGTSGFSAFGGTHTIQLNGGTGTVQWGTTNFLPLTNTTLQLNFFNSNALVDFQNDLDLNTTSGRLLSVRDNPNSSTDVGRVSGVISNSAGAGALVVTGNGVLELTAANTYTGQTLVYDSVLTGGSLRLVGSGSFANSSIVTVGPSQSLDVSAVTGGANFSAAANRFAVASGQTLTGTGTVTGGVFVGAGATIRGGTLADTLNTPTGQLTVAGPLRLVGGGTLAVDLNGTSTSGATVSRVAVTGAGNTWDINAVNAPATIRLVGDQSLVANQSYTFTIASSAGGFTRDGNAVSSYTYGSDFVLSTANWGSFNNVSLTVSGTNLVLTFTPVPEPLTVGVVAVAGLGLVGAIRRRRTVV